MVLKIDSRYSNKVKSRPQTKIGLKQKKDKKRPKFNSLWVLGIVLLSIASWFGYQILRASLLKPEAVLVLGGHEEREVFAAKFAHNHPDLPIWVSGGSPSNYAQKIFAKQGIEGDRLTLDYQAVDTLTNFTTLIDDLKKAGIENVYLITSENHINRAQIIGLIVFGSQGIAIKPIAVPSEAQPESVNKCLRDGLRALIWVFTGETGSELKLEKS